MIYHALCHHLDKSPQSSLTALVPPLANNQLCIDDDIDKDNNIFNIVKALIKQVYDIAADDARLRSLASQAFAGEVVFGEGFDGLRKHYPTRREFHNYQVHLENITDTDKKWLQVLGFHCV
jgi:erythronate-4-phosphate dehydrogenase